MPICSRCTGIYLGIIIGIITDFLKSLWNMNAFYPSIIFTLFLIPIAIDGTGQLFGLWESNNKRRFLTGLLVGLSAGATIRIIIRFFIGE